MRLLLYRALILLAVIGLIFTPPLLTGYVTMRNADSAMDAGNFSDAADQYIRALRLLPWRQDLWEQAATAKFYTGDYAASISYFEQAKQTGSMSASGWNLLGQAYWSENDLESARLIWQKGLETHPSSILLFSPLLAFAYREQGNFAAEQDVIEQWFAAGGTQDEGVHYRLGLLLADSDSDRANQEFLLASSLNPAYDPAAQTMRTALNLASLETSESSELVIIGRGLGLVDEWSLAEEAFRQAVAADGESAEAWAWLGEAEQQLGRDGRAELDKALSLDRTNPIVRSLRGLYWTRQGRGDQALAEYLLAAEYDPENPARQISIGDAHALRGDLQAALGAYLHATEMDPTEADLWRLLAEFSARYNMQVEDVGLPAARKAVGLSGEDPLALDTLGWALALLERYDEAQDTLEQAISLDPDLATAHLHLAIVAMQTDNWESAHDHFIKARALDPVGSAGEQAQLLLDQYFP